LTTLLAFVCIIIVWFHEYIIRTKFKTKVNAFR